MSQNNSEMAGRIRRSVQNWFTQRMQECVRCSECGNPVVPWTPYCQNCGQANPAKVSASAGVCLAIAFVLLAVIGSYLISAF